MKVKNVLVSFNHRSGDNENDVYMLMDKKESKKYNFWVGKKHRFPDSSFKKSPHTSSKKS